MPFHDRFSYHGRIIRASGYPFPAGRATGQRARGPKTTRSPGNVISAEGPFQGSFGIHFLELDDGVRVTLRLLEHDSSRATRPLPFPIEKCPDLLQSDREVTHTTDSVRFLQLRTVPAHDDGVDDM